MSTRNIKQVVSNVFSARCVSSASFSRSSLPPNFDFTATFSDSAKNLAVAENRERSALNKVFKDFSRYLVCHHDDCSVFLSRAKAFELDNQWPDAL